jgi:predicted 3-demethylubiquinone-9 3-methyltransferase (glyoxalase superfamily)
MQKITPFLWFNNQAEKAMNFYTSIFKNSKKLKITHYGDGGPMPKGTVMTVSFVIDGQEFSGINGGPMFKFSEAISLVVNCESQEEIDYYWEKLSEGGQVQQCGWLKDKFGLSWQIFPVVLADMLADKDRAKSQRVMAEVMQMIKLDIATLKQAYQQP